MELLEQVEAYLARTRVPPSTFGRMALGDPRFVDDLRSGRHPRRKTQEKVRAYLAGAGMGSTEVSPCDPRLHAADDPEPHSPCFQQIGFDTGNEMQALF